MICTLEHTPDPEDIPEIGEYSNFLMISNKILGIKTLPSIVIGRRSVIAIKVSISARKEYEEVAKGLPEGIYMIRPASKEYISYPEATTIDRDLTLHAAIRYSDNFQDTPVIVRQQLDLTDNHSGIAIVEGMNKHDNSIFLDGFWNNNHISIMYHQLPEVYTLIKNYYIKMSRFFKSSLPNKVVFTIKNGEVFL